VTKVRKSKSNNLKSDLSPLCHYLKKMMHSLKQKILSTTTTTTTIKVFMKDSKWNQGIDPTSKLFPTPSFTTRK